MKKKLFPRDGPGSIEIKDGVGPLTAVCACGDFLEMYKAEKTFRIQSPESVDPDRTDPNAPWIVSPVADVGSSNPIVARVLLQGNEILKGAVFDRKVDKEAITQQLHSCKELLLTCEAIAKRIAVSVDQIVQSLSTDGVTLDKRRRAINPFPQVGDLDIDCGSFLIHANRAIKIISGLPHRFIRLDRADNNFDYLAERLAKTLGKESPLTQFVLDNATGVRHLIELRNFHEHPKVRRTIIENFRLMPDSRIRPPVWHLSDEDPQPIKEEMKSATEFLLVVAEAVLIHAVMQAVSRNFPFIIEEIPTEEIDRKIPIKYRLSLDISKLKLKKPE